VLSLAQGVVHWTPPRAATEAAARALSDNPAVHAYGACEGLPELRGAIKRKLLEENGLANVDVMVTTGANQAFMNVVLSVADSSDRIVLFVPYYFNHLMALQMTEGGPQVTLGACDAATMLPDLDWLERELAGGAASKPPKAVVIVTPNNPTGVIVPKEMLERAAALCESANAWLVVDNTYENFTYADTEVKPTFLASRNVINIFSFSKCYGMMGWRMGYLSYDAANAELAQSLLKVQDTIPICPTQISQHVALGALEAGAPWIADRVKLLETNRSRAVAALAPLGQDNAIKSEGAIYLWYALPPMLLTFRPSPPPFPHSLLLDRKGRSCSS